LLPQGCTKDKIVNSEVCEDSEITTYDDVRQILTGSCGAGTTQCHIPGGQSPDYTSYETMEASLTFDRFQSRVLINMDMPQSGFPPLDSIEFKKVKCWVEGGYQN